MALTDLTFDNRFTLDLPADPSTENRPRQVTNAAFSRVAPTPTSGPKVLAHSPEVLADLGLTDDVANTDEFVSVMSGNATLDAMDPYAACYGGHQFGHWADQLGDGRAIGLGEVVANGLRHTLQLKGAGPTPYSRRADGLAVLRSSVREFLCSEAMYHLGVPTTRALSLATTGDQVMRDMFYDGHPALETGAVVCRVAPSFIRFGTFELPASRGDIGLLRQLADHAIAVHFPDIADGRTGGFDTDDYVAWFSEVVRSTAEMIVHWQRVGFVHGVMNTDNMSIHGLTIDYGPYGWLEGYDPGWTPNTTDRERKRYRFGSQPHVGQWNCTQLANALIPLVGETEPLEAALSLYADTFNQSWPEMMAAKLGLASYDENTDQELIHDGLSLLTKTETDMTWFFRELATVSSNPDTDDTTLASPLEVAYYDPDGMSDDLRSETVAWLRQLQQRWSADGRNDADRAAAMNAVNPRFVLRNYLAQLVIDDADQGNTELLDEVLDTLRTPYDDQPGRERFAEKRPEWARSRPGCSMLSCSS